MFSTRRAVRGGDPALSGDLALAAELPAAQQNLGITLTSSASGRGGRAVHAGAGGGADNPDILDNLGFTLIRAGRAAERSRPWSGRSGCAPGTPAISTISSSPVRVSRRGGERPRPASLHRDGFREVARLVHVVAARLGDVVGEQLQRTRATAGQERLVAARCRGGPISRQIPAARSVKAITMRSGSSLPRGCRTSWRSSRRAREHDHRQLGSISAIGPCFISPPAYPSAWT